MTGQKDKRQPPLRDQMIIPTIEDILASLADAAPLQSNLIDLSLIIPTAKALSRKLNALDINLIDGEFYWRCCCDGLRQRLIAARGMARSVQRSPGTIRSENLCEQLEEICTELYLDYRFPPSVFAKHISYRGFLELRGATVRRPRHHDLDVLEPYGDNDFLDFLLIRIGSSTWKRKDVEELARSWLGSTPVRLGGEYGIENEETAPLEITGPSITYESSNDNVPSMPEAELSINLGFQMHMEGLLEDLLDYRPWLIFDPGNRTFAAFRSQIKSPYIQVRIGLPMHENAISREYDKIAIREEKWNETLCAGGNRQTVWSAIRGWTAGLLYGAGMTMPKAIAEFDRYFPYQPTETTPDQQLVEQNRDLILVRVPEAVPFLRLG